ncbi:MULTISPECIES: hypothetical protein [Thermoanaerobacterium]|uniref:Uncharacterized protein n=1 Tax=Thermoanaerobacterium xylanolyticum (strain ATCC 49914 / DSM 7097 / LX-11) TaxID=858215 RepID=F6BKY8_THEXL|nr:MULTISPECIES: hypothetical protein [Thermoanaerobacterium]AEF17172.1 hypothetical protein Thexy_1139 [Thermoanaerobacterium xylanolyticum LX-11]MDE4541652.1 hypothetical protein [Thermoanaerobacterium sp. R66]
MDDKGKYLKGFLTGAAAAAFILPRINSKRVRQLIQMGLTKIAHRANKM